MQLGVDVGGTHTDAVAVLDRRVVGTAKVQTTADVTAGIAAALRGLLASSGLQPQDVTAVAVGTTHFTNAVVEARDLARTAVIRFGLPAAAGIPPMTGWPAHLRSAVGGQIHLCHGGHDFDGRAISPLDPDEVKRAAGSMMAAGITSAAIASIFSPLNREFEQRAADILRAELPDVRVSLSHEIGRIGLLERENATILNASLLPMAEKTTAAFARALADIDVWAPLYLSQNDGTLMDVDYVRRYPVATFAAGPTNSMRGAALLSEREDCVVVDIGGTTTDVGVVANGFPRPSPSGVDIAGVRMNFRMPDVVSLAIGGGSLVTLGDEVSIGPGSVGHRLASEARVFGGSTLTATDIAVAAGLAELGEPGAVADLPPEMVRAAAAQIAERIEAAAVRMREPRSGTPLVIVGGGCILLPESLAGFDEVIRPDGFSVANAIGAAIAEVGGEIDQVYTLVRQSRQSAVDDACAKATSAAIEAGADPSRVRIVEIEELPIDYLPGNAIRVRAKAAGAVATSWRPLDDRRVGA